MVDLDMSAIVIDNGSGTTKCGFSGERSPRSIFPSIVGRLKSNPGIMTNSSGKWAYVGNEAQNKRGILRLKYPIEHGLVTNWLDMEEIYRHVFENELKVQVKTDKNSDNIVVPYPVLLTESPLNPKNNREKMVSMMFDGFCTPAVYIGIQEVLSLYVSGRSTGIVLGIGDGVTHIVPVYEGCAIQHSILRMNIGGRDITNYLVKIISERGYDLNTSPVTAERVIVNDIKEKITYVCLEYENEIKKDKRTCDCEQEYELPDGSKMTVGSERFRAPEILFKPYFIGSEVPGIHETIINSIQKCDIDLRNDLYKNIVLSGGSTLFNGIVERLQLEIEQLAPIQMKVRIHAPEERKYSAWIGGSIISSLTSFNKMWITKDEFEDVGATVVHRKCFTGGGISSGSGMHMKEDEEYEDLMERILFCCERENSNMNVFTFTFDCSCGFSNKFEVSKCFLML